MTDQSELVEQILNSRPSPGTYLVVLSELKNKGEYERVVQESLKALTHYPDDVRLRALLAEAYWKLGYVGLAESELETADSAIQELADLYKLQAELYLEQMRLEPADQAVNRCLAHRPEDREALRLLDRINAAREEHEEHEPREDASTQGDLATPTLAEIYYNQGQIQDAIETYRQVLSRDPDDQTSRQRLSELEASAQAAERASQEDTFRSGTERLIAVLEDWRDKIRSSPQ